MIDEAKQGKGSRKLAEKHNVSKTQVVDCVKNENKHLNDFNSGQGDSKYTPSRHCSILTSTTYLVYEYVCVLSGMEVLSDGTQHD